ncbi:MAG: DNA polymerase sliding clamp C [Methanobacterium sp. PtaU1.Bin242]|nr:MAG: DNA polymerase sliding clamp C [Methanobacterium sp. PtaU1.Bin242]
MFKIAINYSDKLKSVVEMLYSLTENVTMEITSEGLEIKDLDDSHITYIYLKAPKKVFSNFTLKGDVERFGLDIEKFQDLINLAQEDDQIVLEKDDNNPELIISFENIDRRIFKLPSALLELESPEMPVFDDEGYVKIKIPLKLFKNEIETLENASAGYSAKFIINKDKLIIETKPGADKTGGLVEYSHGERVLKSVMSVYSLEKLSKILKAEASEIISLEMDDEMPVRIKSELSNGGELVFLLAPRIED